MNNTYSQIDANHTYTMDIRYCCCCVPLSMLLLVLVHMLKGPHLIPGHQRAHKRLKTKEREHIRYYYLNYNKRQIKQGERKQWGNTMRALVARSRWNQGTSSLWNKVACIWQLQSTHTHTHQAATTIYSCTHRTGLITVIRVKNGPAS